MSEKPEKCAWCGKEPQTYSLTTDADIRVGCLDKDCPNAIPITFSIVNWNIAQRRILARRRADFEAGYDEGVCGDERISLRDAFDARLNAK